MASIRFRLKGGSDPVSITARLYHDGFSCEVKTGFQINKKDWSKSKQRVKQNKNSANVYDRINIGLSELETYFHKQINNAISEKNPISNGWLKEIVPKCFNQPLKEEDNEKYYFTPFVEKFIKHSETAIKPKTGRPLSKRTIHDYKGTLKKLLQYEANEKLKLRHLDINLKFHQKFVNLCKNQYKITDKTIGGEIDNIRLFCRRAERKNYKVSQEFKTADFYSPDNKTHNFPLSEKEVKSIEDIDLSDNERLNNARNWFVVGIWTGLRVGDLLNLTDEHLDGDFIRVTNQKTGIPVVIPIHSSVKKVLDEGGNNFPRKISPTKFNDYIKEVAKAAGLTKKVTGAKRMPIEVDKNYSETGKSEVYRKKLGVYEKWELVSSHICRRTFATFHYGKLDTLTIMNVTGHKTERQFLEYVKITPKEHAEEMKKMWSKYYNVGE